MNLTLFVSHDISKYIISIHLKTCIKNEITQKFTKGERKRATATEIKHKAWSTAKKYGFSMEFRATPLDWMGQLMGSYLTFINILNLVNLVYVEHFAWLMAHFNF